MKTGFSIAAVLTITLLATVLTPVHGNKQNINSCMASLSPTLPKVILQPGTTGNEIISTNSTNALVQVSATTQNWLTGWSYRQQHNITSASGADVGYQLNITISNATGTSSGNVCYANGHVRNSDFSDIRVTASDGITLLSIWNETVNSGTNATIWFKDTDNLTSTTSTVYVYYGNIGVSPVWNGVSTFIFFDNFTGTSLNTTAWTTCAGSAGSYGTNNGLTLSTSTTYGSGGYVHVYTVSTQSTTNTIAEASMNPSGAATSWDILAWDKAAPSSSGANDAGFTAAYRFEDYPSSYWRLVKDASGSGTTIAGGTTGGSGTATLVKLGAYWPSTGTEKLFINNIDTLDGADSSIGHANSYLDLVLESNSASAQSLVIYWCRVRRYVSSEPAQGAWGTEQSAQSGQYWLGGWSYRQQHNITQTSGAGTGYQFNITVCNGTGTSSGPICYANGHVENSDFSDVRITDSTGNGTLAIWNASVNYVANPSNANHNNATIWFQDSDNLTSTGSTVYVYYGNSGASYVGNGTNTFNYYDDGSSTSSWNVAGSAGSTAGVGNPAPSLYAISSRGSYMYKGVGLAPSMLITFSVRSNGLGNLYFLTDSTGAGQMYRIDTRGVNYYAGFATTTSWTSWGTPSSGFTATSNTWYKFGINVSSTSATLFYQQTTDSTPNLPTTTLGTYTISNNGGYIGLVGSAYGSSYTSWWDDIIVRNYIYPEPVQGAWGAEQSADVLDVVNQVAVAWNLGLQVYGSSNVARLSSVTVSFHDGTLSNQIVINNGIITQSQGQPYTLPAGAGSTIYISLYNLLANTTGTSYLYACLETVPSYSSPLNVLHITFQVT